MGKANRGPALRLMAWLLAMLVLAGCTPQWGRNNGGGQARAGHLIIAEVYSNGFVGDGSDAYIRLHNPTDAAVSLAGWSVGDAKARATFPAGARIGAQQSLYIARTEAGFRKLFGAPPGYVWGGGGSAAAPAMNGGAAFKPGAQAGTVVLRDGTGAPVDTVVWGAPPEAGVTGWKGQPAAAPFKGIVLDRSRDEAAWTAAAPGPYARDTDSAADWKQGGHWLDLRVLRPGQTWFGYPTYTVSGVTAYASPDSTYQVLTDLLDRARRSIDLNIYDFQLAPVAEKLAAAARRGVTLRVLIEAQSSQKLDDQERYVAKLITAGGGQVRWIVNDPGRGINGRYVYNHAKYIVVDGRTTMGHT